MATFEGFQTKPLNQGAFACPGNACEPDPQTLRFAGGLIQQRFDALLVLGQGAFDPGDGLGERISLSLFDRSREANRIPAASFFDEGFGGSSGAFFGLVIA